MTIILVDTNILGILASPANEKAISRMYELYCKGAQIFTSELCDYEIRRNIILTQLDKNTSRKARDLSQKSLSNLDNLKKEGYIEYLSINSVILEKAAKIWAETQILGIPLTNPAKLDIDSIICAHWQASSEENPGRKVIVATTNIRHLSQFADVQQWEEIKI